jgi:hypothetical protein
MDYLRSEARVSRMGRIRNERIITKNGNEARHISLQEREE